MKLSIEKAAMATLLSLATVAAASDSPPVPLFRVVNEVRVPLILDLPNYYYVLSPDAQFVEVFFDASASYDPDGDKLFFGWGAQRPAASLALKTITHWN